MVHILVWDLLHNFFAYMKRCCLLALPLFSSYGVYTHVHTLVIETKSFKGYENINRFVRRLVAVCLPEVLSSIVMLLK